MCYCFYSHIFLTKACIVILVLDTPLFFLSISRGGHLIRLRDSLIITDTRSAAVRLLIPVSPPELSDETSWTGEGIRKHGRPRRRRAHIATLEIRISE